MTNIQKENKSGGKVPNLRFPEFEGDWEVRKLGEIATNFMYGMNTAATVYDGENQYIRITDIDERTRLFTPNPLSSPDGELEDKYLLEKGDILFARTGASVGKSYLYNEKDGKIFFAGFLIRLNVKTENPYFIFSQTLTEKYQKWVLIMSMRSGQPGINAEEYKLLPITLPPFEEQAKISSFLALLDERIQTQSKILIHLKSLIESLNDSLLEQKIRINYNFKKWKKVKLGDLGYTFNGLSGKTKEDFGQGKKYIQYKQIFDSSTIEIKNCGYVMVSENENQNNVKYGDVFFTTSSETPNEIGMSSVLLEDVKDVYLNSFCFGFRLNSFDEMLPEFARFLFRSKVVRNEIKKLAQGSTRYNMSKTELLKLEILLPSIEEQKQIATFLSKIDQKIQTEKAILEQLEIQKKYLLKEMFV
ncbi:restriction endonuclease subunit S [Chryseobacterium binzhouense]|uniref:restriction endonuclease subunit S n=1 Tax=Chryseobacterium binzhouense TaxID=2593646 RepID=UPI00289D8A24|nr:restriction endonuclease subunit S [Chryseobacterium binzhouense]